MSTSLTIIQYLHISCRRFGWRWAFLMQLPLFFASFMLTSINLHYVTPVSRYPSLCNGCSTSDPQGKSKSTKEVLKRIDYAGSATLLGAVRHPIIKISRNPIHNSRRSSCSWPFSVSASVRSIRCADVFCPECPSPDPSTYSGLLPPFIFPWRLLYFYSSRSLSSSYL